ncbi:MAG: hypothetical protein CMF80_05030 [Candidatus Marinimicrobia bacterium]|nr:hypothetical protein [Candidatus Neomarinimicrobiota bacterium]|tara:strand:+ start:67 stop:354 length:288 start_codon:yes stop_codon:yes gene_type:complete
MKKILPLLLKGLVVLVVLGILGFGVYSYINSIKTLNDNLIIELKEKTDELNELKFQEAEKNRLEREKYVSDLEKQVEILTKDNDKLSLQIKELSE